MKKIIILISIICFALVGYGQIESDNVIKYKGDLSGEYDDATLVPKGYVDSVSGVVYASQGLIKDADTVKLGGEVGNVILSVQIDSAITIGDSLHYGVTIYNRGDTLTEVDMFAGYANEDIPISSGIGVTTDKITLQSTGIDIITTLQIDTTGVYYADLPPSSGLTDNHFITKGYADSVGDPVVTVNITSSNILNADSLLILPAPGAGKMYLITDVVALYNYGTAEYTGGSNSNINYINQTGAGVTPAIVIKNTWFQGAVNFCSYAMPYTGEIYKSATSGKILINSPLWLDISTGITTGDGTAILKVYYKIVDFN